MTAPSSSHWTGKGLNAFVPLVALSGLARPLKSQSPTSATLLVSVGMDMGNE